MPVFTVVPERPSFPDEEEKILEEWRRNDTFKRCYARSVEEGRPPYTFYDGPPFATGLPHYGHLLAGAVKDTMTRYAHQMGYSVERRFGWDCHGLPVEHEIDKKLGIKSRNDVLVVHGIHAYNEQCRSIVQRYSEDWRKIVERTGRWIDFDNDYKTMDRSYMESVWWVFKQLFDKGLVYRAYKVMPYSTACTTPLSNFEAGQNYKEVVDPSVVITFPCVEDPSISFLAWTTTPWTLSSNLALCVHPEMTYLKVKTAKDDRLWVVCESRLPWICEELKLNVETDDVTIVERVKGSSFVGLHYEPLFDCFARLPYWSQRAFRVVADEYVTDDAGTGVVHQAPGFGEDDHRVCLREGVLEKEGRQVFVPVDSDGVFTEDVPFLQGRHCKSVDKDIKRMLKEAGRLVVSTEFRHQYPHCWRSDMPLIYKAVPSWFIRVEILKERLLAANEKTYWVPSFVKEKRFHNWLADARDWCVSRNRYWGTPIPLWASADFQELVCLSSISELEQHAGRKLDDIHRHKIDDITIPDPRGGDYPPLRRVEEVFDCWFESGSMPYAQLHYPFENQEKFQKGFPANFIAEGLDQTRGWFYTLMVLSTALFDQPAFQNLVVNGLVLTADGKKMSKRLKNYPDPTEMIHHYGADALRLYLLNSPAVRADTLKFNVPGVRDCVKDILLPWYHAMRFFFQEATRMEAGGRSFQPNFSDGSAQNEMDIWLRSTTHSLIKSVKTEMENYHLYSVAPLLINFLDQLTNWYVRLNRDRCKGGSGPLEQEVALRTLYEVLLLVNTLMAPMTPFISEFFYSNLKKALPEGHQYLKDTVHDVFIPEYQADLVHPEIEERVSQMQAVILLGRILREKRKVGIKTPLKHIKIIRETLSDGLPGLQKYIQDELNVLEVEFSTDTSLVELTAVPNFKRLGERVGKAMQQISKTVKQLDAAAISQFKKTGSIKIAGFTLSDDDIIVKKQVRSGGLGGGNLEADSDGDILVVIDFTSDDQILELAISREAANRIQKLRKEMGLSESDNTTKMAAWTSDDSIRLKKILQQQKNFIESLLRRPLLDSSLPTGKIVQRDFDLSGEVLTVAFYG